MYKKRKTKSTFKQLREKLGYTQAETASYLKTSINTIVRLENETVGHQSYYVRKRATELFGVPDTVLFPEKVKKFLTADNKNNNL